MQYSTDLAFHYEILKALARRLKPALYVGLGIESGNCIQRGAPHCQREIGVDVNEAGNGGGYEFFHGTTEEFALKRLPELPRIEMAFIDADHRHEASLKDFEPLLPFVADNGIILLHDTYPEARERLSDELCSDSFRTAALIAKRALDYDVEVVTLPIPPGISLVRERRRHLHRMPETISESA